MAGGGGVATGLVDATGAGDSRLTIEKVALYQATEVTLFEAGEETTPKVPIIAERGAELRVFLRREPGFEAKSVVGVLTLGGKRGETTASATLTSGTMK